MRQRTRCNKISRLRRAKQDPRQTQCDAGKKPRVPEAKAPSETPAPKARYNFTDPQSSIMKAGSGRNFEQTYNAQAAVDQVMLIVGAQVRVATNDKRELMYSGTAFSSVVANHAAAVLVYSGFYSEGSVQAIEQHPVGMPTGMTVYAAVGNSSHHKTVDDLLPQSEPPAPGPGASAKEKIAYRLKARIGQQHYKQREQTAEPVFGIIKKDIGFRRSSLRAFEKVSLEWILVCVSHNLKRLFSPKNRHQTADQARQSLVGLKISPQTENPAHGAKSRRRKLILAVCRPESKINPSQNSSFQSERLLGIRVLESLKDGVHPA